MYIQHYKQFFVNNSQFRSHLFLDCRKKYFIMKLLLDHSNIFKVMPTQIISNKYLMLKSPNDVLCLK